MDPRGEAAVEGAERQSLVGLAAEGHRPHADVGHMDGALAEAAALHGSILRSERGAPSLGCASQPCNQISSASEPTSSAAIVQLNARSRADRKSTSLNSSH